MKKILFLLLLAACSSISHAEDSGSPLPEASVPKDLYPKEKKQKSEPATSTQPSSAPKTEKTPWFRNAGEYIAHKSTRLGVPTDTNTKIHTDAKRFDVGIGKRIPIFSWGETSPAQAWVIGVDGGMHASLTRFSKNGNLTFATNTFDGFFGAFLARGFSDGWQVMFRTAHLSAHLVDNAPTILNPISYSQFWNEIIVNKTFPAPEVESDWEISLQGSVGLNNSSAPTAKQPRYTGGASFGYGLSGPDSVAILASADMLNAGVRAQDPTYLLFLGLGTLNRPQSTHRPLRVGVAHLAGSDFRNQYFAKKQNWTTFEIATDF